MTTIGRQALQAIAAGRPIAMAGLREYEAVIAAAVAIFKSGAGYDALEKALRDGGWLNG